MTSDNVGAGVRARATGFEEQLAAFSKLAD
jgi:hypothetical protein